MHQQHDGTMLVLGSKEVDDTAAKRLQDFSQR